MLKKCLFLRFPSRHSSMYTMTMKKILHVCIVTAILYCLPLFAERAVYDTFSNIGTLFDDYTIDFGMEQTFRIKDGVLETDGSCSVSINEDGFLEFNGNGWTCFILDHDITQTVAESFVQRNYVLNETRLKAISADGFFSETLNGVLTEYRVDNLRTAVIRGFERGSTPMYTNPVPFVTKRGSSGIGEKICLECVEPISSISILPGYVSTVRPDLFRKNNRPKKLKIKDTDTGFYVLAELSDVALFQEIPLRKPMRNIEIEILEIYSGTVYDDTCISGILID